MRFLVTPYVKQFSGMPEEEAMLARIAITPVIRLCSIDDAVLG